MPWALVIRAVARIAAGLFLWRVATARRGAYRTAGGPPMPDAAAQTRPVRLGDLDALRRIRETASLGWRLVSAGVLLLAAALLLTGGITLTALSPRWLGIALLVLAAFAIVALVVELLTVRRLLSMRHLRRRDAELRREVG